MINNKYSIRTLLGTGGSANCFLIRDTEGEYSWAKIMKEDEKYSEGQMLQLLWNEVQIMEKLHYHPNILEFKEVLFGAEAIQKDKTEKVTCIITELASNNSLSGFLRRHGGLGERIGCFMFNQIISAISFMHERSIAHGDIKPQNIMLDNCYNIKVGDFGTSEIMVNSEFSTFRKGTKRYMGPELFPLDSCMPYEPIKADIYSLGITLLSIITGELDCRLNFSDNFTTLNSKINENSNLSWADQKRVNLDCFQLSDEVKDLLSWMLQSDPDKRPTVQDIANHIWLYEGSAEFSPFSIWAELLAIVNNINL